MLPHFFIMRAAEKNNPPAQNVDMSTSVRGIYYTNFLDLSTSSFFYGNTTKNRLTIFPGKE